MEDLVCLSIVLMRIPWAWAKRWSLRRVETLALTGQLHFLTWSKGEVVFVVLNSLVLAEEPALTVSATSVGVSVSEVEGLAGLDPDVVLR